MSKNEVFILYLLIIGAWISLGVFYTRKANKLKGAINRCEERPINHISVHRLIEGNDIVRKYKVYVDKQLVGRISVGETLHIKKPPGCYEVKVKIDWCSSKPLLVELKENENVELECFPINKDWRCLYKIYTDFSNYLGLKFA